MPCSTTVRCGETRVSLRAAGKFSPASACPQPGCCPPCRGLRKSDEAKACAAARVRRGDRRPEASGGEETWTTDLRWLAVTFEAASGHTAFHRSPPSRARSPSIRASTACGNDVKISWGFRLSSTAGKDFFSHDSWLRKRKTIMFPPCF